MVLIGFSIGYVLGYYLRVGLWPEQVKCVGQRKLFGPDGFPFTEFEVGRASTAILNSPTGVGKDKSKYVSAFCFIINDCDKKKNIDSRQKNAWAAARNFSKDSH